MVTREIFLRNILDLFLVTKMKSSSIIPFLALVSAAASAASPATCTSTSETPLQIDTRNLSEIYAAAQQEQGILQVAYGGDGATRPAPTLPWG